MTIFWQKNKIKMAAFPQTTYQHRERLIVPLRNEYLNNIESSYVLFYHYEWT